LVVEKNIVKKIYLKYWGKAGFLFDKYSCHLLPYHCLDVAAVGRFLLDPEKPLCRHLAARLKVCPDWLKIFLCFVYVSMT
jgi:CRISPR-associated endonuclease/helicase Cas3